MNLMAKTSTTFSKLFVFYVVKALSVLTLSENGEPELIVIACCPSFCKTDLGRQYDAWYERVFARLFYATFGRSREEGSRTLVSAAALGVECQGGFWKNNQLLRYAFVH